MRLRLQERLAVASRLRYTVECKRYFSQYRMNTLSVILAMFSLASCIGAPQTQFVGPNDKMVYAITCETVDDCEAEAHKLCPSQYDIVLVASGTNDTSAKGGIGDTPPRRMAVTCR